MEVSLKAFEPNALITIDTWIKEDWTKKKHTVSWWSRQYIVDTVFKRLFTVIVSYKMRIEHLLSNFIDFV